MTIYHVYITGSNRGEDTTAMLSEVARLACIMMWSSKCQHHLKIILLTFSALLEGFLDINAL